MLCVLIFPKNRHTKTKNIINKINKERRRSINATPYMYDPATRTKEPQMQARAQDRARTGRSFK
jgi:hypothetical protein